MQSLVEADIQPLEYSKTCLQIDKTKVLKTGGSLMQVESIAAFCSAFDMH